MPSNFPQGQWRWEQPAGEPAFHSYVSDVSADYAGTLVGYEGLDNLTKQDVPIAGGDRGQ